MASSLWPMVAGAGDHLPALLAYAANKPIPVATATDQMATSVQAKQRRKARDPPRKSAVPFSDLKLLD